MIRSLSCLALSTQAAFAGFCTESVADLGLSSAIVAPEAMLTLHDQGSAQIFCMTCVPGFLTIEVTLGVDASGTGAGLADGSVTAETLQAECRTDFPNCTVTPIGAGQAVGFLRLHSGLGMSQALYRLFLDGQTASVRATAPADSEEAVQAAARRVHDAILPTLLNCT
jgi:hypothetical protein